MLLNECHLCCSLWWTSGSSRGWPRRLWNTLGRKSQHWLTSSARRWSPTAPHKAFRTMLPWSVYAGKLHCTCGAVVSSLIISSESLLVFAVLTLGSVNPPTEGKYFLVLVVSNVCYCMCVSVHACPYWVVLHLWTLSIWARVANTVLLLQNGSLSCSCSNPVRLVCTKKSRSVGQNVLCQACTEFCRRHEKQNVNHTSSGLFFKKVAVSMYWVYVWLYAFFVVEDTVFAVC